jgi:hypothetical protein
VTSLGPIPGSAAPMGLTLIEAAKYETRLEHLAVIKTSIETSLKKEVVQQKWKVNNDRERWPTVEAVPLMLRSGPVAGSRSCGPAASRVS